MKKILSLVFNVLAFALIVAAIVLLLVTAALLSAQVALTVRAAPVALAITRLLPRWLAFFGVLSTPFGGVFRTDFVILSLVAFVLSRIMRKIARAF